MRRTFGTEPLDDTIVTYAWDEGEFAQVEAYANSLPRAQPQAPGPEPLAADAADITDDTRRQRQFRHHAQRDTGLERGHIHHLPRRHRAQQSDLLGRQQHQSGSHGHDRAGVGARS